MSGDAGARETLEQELARLDALTGALERVGDEKAREAARELLALLLDLHGRAFERLNTMIAESKDGQALFHRIAEDKDISAMLLLHGLHPKSVEERLQEVIARMQPQWRARGLRVDLASAGAAFAIVQLKRNGRAEPSARLRLEIESALTDAAPDLEDILIELDMTEICAETAA